MFGADTNIDGSRSGYCMGTMGGVKYFENYWVCHIASTLFLPWGRGEGGKGKILVKNISRVGPESLSR